MFVVFKSFINSVFIYTGNITMVAIQYVVKKSRHVEPIILGEKTPILFCLKGQICNHILAFCNTHFNVVETKSSD